MRFLRKLLVVLIVFIFQGSSLGHFFQFADFGVNEVYAQGQSSKTDLVAIIVSNEIFGSIQGDLQRYTSQYIPKQAPGTKSLVIPVDPNGFEASDIQQILENLYYDGQQNVSSQLVGVILLGELPWPVVELDSRRFVSLYPYVDFEDPMFLYDPVEDVFLYNDAPNSLPELRHSTIPTNDTGLFSKFFSKLKQYDANPKSYAKQKIWYDDFPYLKKSFAKEELERYLNTLVFAEEDSFRTDVPMFSRLLSRNYEEELVEHVDEAKAAIDKYQAQAPSHDSVSGHPETEAAASEILAGVNTMFERLEPNQLRQSIVETGEAPIPTKITEREMEQHFQPGYQVFGNYYLSELESNILAGGRYAAADIDTSLEKMEIRDRVSKQFVKDMNWTMEEALNEKVLEEDYQLKFPLPYRFSKWRPWYEPEQCGGLFYYVPYDLRYFEKVFTDFRWTSIQNLFFGKQFLQGDFMGLVIGGFGGLNIGGVFRPDGLEVFERARYENFYFGKNAVDITSFKDLTIYRGTYLNELNQDNARGYGYTQFQSDIDDTPGFDMSKSSVGASKGIFSQQVEYNKAYNFDRAINERTVDQPHDYKWSDKELYDRYQCGDQEVDAFSYDFRAGASVMNIDTEKFISNPKYPETKEGLTDRTLAWNPSEERAIGGPWHDPAGARLVTEEITKDSLHITADEDFGTVLELWKEPKRDRLLRAVSNEPKVGEYEHVLDGRIERCEPRVKLDDIPSRTSYEEIEYFWVYENRFPFPEADWIGITVQPTLGFDEDQDSDGIADLGDDDRDGDNIPNKEDDDQDGDRIHFSEDIDLDGDGVRNGRDDDIDQDLIKNKADGDQDDDGVPDSADEDTDQDFMVNKIDNDIDADGIPNPSDHDMDGDGIPNEKDPDMDGDGIPNGKDDDKDADRVPDQYDKSCNGGGGCNGGSSNVDADEFENSEDDDIDGDGLLNGVDRDCDGDGLLNYEDGDIDGDGLLNTQDAEMDGDGLLNTEDPDIDGDGILNEDDDTPTGKAFIAESSTSHTLTDEACSGENDDIDDDGILNMYDLDVDGDGYHNVADADIDGDGLSNGNDDDIDCDGIKNGDDRDCDGDGEPNATDADCDGDGLLAHEDDDDDGDGLKDDDPAETDQDGDGIPDSVDPDSDGDRQVDAESDDCDGDGIPNGEDYEDINGNGIPNDQDPNMDCDDLPNDIDPDMDGDGIDNVKDGDCNCNGKSNAVDSDDDGDGIPDEDDDSPQGYDLTQKLSKREDRGDVTCFLSGFDYRYQIIDSLVIHRNPNETELDNEATILTVERPVDDGRYVTFHGIGGDQVYMIYPDLYNVPIYDGCLSEPDQIEEVIKTYLRDKVTYYNQLLQEQLSKAPGHYATHPAAFDHLASVDIAASPNRSYELIPGDFFVDLLGDKNIKRLGIHLHTLSQGRGKRPQGGTIGEFIENARDEFSINKKLQYVVYEYLKNNDAEDPIKFDQLAYPTHIPKDFAYEVGYINSDGYDYAQPQEPLNDQAEEAVAYGVDSSHLTNVDVGNTSHPGAVTAITDGTQRDAECGIPSDRAVPILKRPGAFTCWMRSTLQDPVDFTFELEYDLSEATSYQDRLGERGSKGLKQLDNFGTTIGKNEGTAAGLIGGVYAAGDEWTLGSISGKSQNSAGGAKDPADKERFNQLAHDFTAYLDPGHYITSDEDSLNIVLASRSDIGAVRITMRSRGKICPQVAGTNLCNSDYSVVGNFFNDEKKLPLRFSADDVGVGSIQLRVCDQQKPDLCAYHPLSLTRGPGSLKKMSIKLPAQKVVAGTTLPIAVEGYDENGNRLSYADISYDLILEGASFDPEGEVTTTSINNFDDAFYLLYTSETPGNISLKMEASDAAYRNQFPTVETSITSKPGKITLTNSEGTPVTNTVSIALPNKSVGFTKVDDNGLVQVREELLPTVRIDVVGDDGGFVAPVTVRSKNGYVEVGEIVEKEVKTSSSTAVQRLFQSMQTTITDGSNPIEFRLLPRGISGDDELIVRSPGLEDQYIPIKITPSGADNLEINLDAEGKEIGDVIEGTVVITDSRGNLFTQTTDVELEARGGLYLAKDEITVAGGQAVFSGTVKSGGSCGCRGKCSGKLSTKKPNPQPDEEPIAEPDVDTPPEADPDGRDIWEEPSGGSRQILQGGRGIPTYVKSEPTLADRLGVPAASAQGVPGGSASSAGGSCDVEERDPLTDPDLRYEDGNVFGSASATIPDVLRPDDPVEGDLNIMYLNLYGYPWGNEKDTTQILNNTKTLSITTFQNLGGSASDRKIVSAMIHPDGTVRDKKNIVKELVAQGGDVVMKLGYNGGIGEISLGSYTEFDLLAAGGEYTDKPSKLVYTPGNSDSVTDSTSFDGGRIYHNDEIVVDFVRGVMDPNIVIRLPEGGGNERRVTYKNKQIGKLRVYRGTSGMAQDTELYRSDYTMEMRPFGSSTNSDQAVTILLDSEETGAGDSTLFESIENSFDPTKNIGFRHEFSPITNFGQGMPVGEATRHFGGISLMNIGDPFLMRIDENRKIKHTKYDGGPGQKVFSDSVSIEDVDLIDYDKDGKKDFLITYKDGGIRVLKNYGGKRPFKDLGMLMIVADGIKETFVGDMNGDGRDDVLVHTKADKLRAYMNEQGQMQVDGRIVCLDIPNGEFNVSQIRQIFATDLDGGGLDIISYDSDGDLKVFYGGGDSYLSRDPFKCDDGWKGRQKQQLLKHFGTTLGGPIADYSLRHWSGLKPIDYPEHDQSFQSSPGGGGGSVPDFKSLSDDQWKEYSKELMTTAKEEALAVGDPEKLFETGKKGIDYVFTVPDVMRPLADHGKEPYGGVRANDQYDGSRFDVSKQFTDKNGGELKKGDIVQVTVSLIPVGGVQGAVYREKLEGPWVLYKNEFHEITSFDDGGLGGAKIDWNIGNGYEFMVYDLDLGGTRSFSYEAQYNGDGYVHIDIETQTKDLFKGSSANSVAGVDSVYAQGGWDSRIRAYPDDGCYKEYWEFSPGEKSVSLDSFLEEKTTKYEDHYKENQDTAEEIFEDNTELTPIERFLGVPRWLQNEVFDNWKKGQIDALVRGGQTTEIDVTGYNDFFVAKAEDTIQRIWKAPIKGLQALGFDEMGLFEDYEFSTRICGGTTFGKKSCGAGLPIPFNNDLLSPGTFNIMGCKPQGPIVPDFFPDFAGVPIFAFPTSVPFVPVWPPMPLGAGGIPPFKGTSSFVRAYATWTTSNGMGMSLCFGKYGQTNFLPDPISDVTGNCMVIASNLGSQCSGEGEDNNPPITKRLTKGKEFESSDVLQPQHHDLYQVGACNSVAKSSSPIVGSALGGQVSVGGETTSIQSTQIRSDQDYLKGGTPFELKIEGGDVKGLAQCMIRKWTEKQSRYFANNALNMQIDLILPTLDKIAENYEDVKDIDADRLSFQYDRENWKDSFKKTSNIGTRSHTTDNKKKNSKLFVPQGVLPATSDLFNNPFDMVAAYFDNVPLLNFDEREVAIEIPWIYQEDINRYQFHLDSWIERNTEIYEGWKKTDVEPTFLTDMERAISVAERNRQVLKQYKELPTKIYELLHSSDQYVTEVVGFSEEFLTQITGWLQDNATRFSLRVDFVIVLKGIIETWQLLLDFSVERQSKCAKCRQDHYDFYSCKLKLLCIDLPILPIPPFHIPNVEIDLSKVTLGIDIILPKFNFVPRKFTLPQLPDLPSPFDAELDVQVPVIPVLPPAPPLPELPTLDLEMDIRLPTLPPAPKIPKLSPVVKAVIEIADVIGTFMCIFKGGIGLTSEKNIKTRVEQLTQRKNDLLPFDEVEVTIPASPVAGYDYKIDSIVDIKADFRELYDLVDGIALEWNTAVDQAVQGTVTKTGKAIGKVIDDIDDIGIDPDIEIGLHDLENVVAGIQNGTATDDQLATVLESKRKNLYKGGTVSEVKASLLEGLAFMIGREDLSQYHQKARAIESVVTRQAVITPNFDGINEIREGVQTLLERKNDEIDEYKELVLNDYDAFIDTLTVFDLISNTDGSQEFTSSLYETDAATIASIKEQRSPMERYFQMNKSIVDGYRGALQNHSAADLHMSQLRYEELRSYLDTLSTKIPTSSSKAQLGDSGIEGPLLAQGAGGATASADPKLDVDFSQFLEGFYVPGADKNFHNVIDRKEKGNDWYRNNTFQIDDVNGDGGMDIINYDENQIYIKYENQNDSFGGGGYSKWYQIGPFASARDLESAVEDTAGWYTIGGEQFKIWDDENPMYSFERYGHSFEAMSFSWKQDPHVAGYLIEISEQAEVLHEKTRGGPGKDDTNRTRYVLALPSSTKHDNIAIEIFDQLDAKSINDYIKDGTIASVTSYDANQITAQSMLNNFDRKRYYTRMAPLRLVEESSGGGGFLGGLFGGDESPEYMLKRVGAWSRQRLAGAQNRADDQEPALGTELVRNINGEKVAKGTMLQGMINTTYTLEAQWTDNGEILKNWIVYDGEIIKVEDGANIQLEDLDYKYPIEEEFLFVAMDQAGNMGQQLIKLAIIVPELKIKEIRYEGAGAEIITELSETIDRGQIKFQKNRYGFWKPLNPDTFSVKPLDPEVKGGLYPFDDDITLSDTDGSELATIDSQTGELEIKPGSGCSSKVSCSGNGKPKVEVWKKDAETGQQENIFTVTYQPKKLASEEPITVLNSLYSLRNIDNTGQSIYDGGTCFVGSFGECEIYVSKKGEIYIPEPYRYQIVGEYGFDEGVVSYTMKTLSGTAIGRIRFIPDSFE